MQRVLVILLVLLILAVGAAWVTAATTAVPEDPLGIHHWLPLPVACADARCITYRRWTALLAHHSGPDEAELLTRLLTHEASVLVARRLGLAVSDEDVEQARGAIAALAAQSPDLRLFLTAQYRDPRSRAFREGLRDLLLRSKLSAAGVASLWSHPMAPGVTIAHLRYRWDPRQHRVVER